MPSVRLSQSGDSGALIATWLDNAIFFRSVELNETAVPSALLSQSGDSGALIATWLDNAIFFRSG